MINFCLKCGEPEKPYRHVDLHGVCDWCAGRGYIENPDWCTVFRNHDGSQPYCLDPDLRDSDHCMKCLVYQENLRAETTLLEWETNREAEQ